MFGIDDMALAMMVTGGITAGTGLWSSAQQVKAGEKTNQMALNESRENREWQERMSSTAHQREVADLRAAGLNPILSATGGSGASTPSGGIARPDNPKSTFAKDMIDTAEATGQSAVNAAQAFKVSQDARKAAAEADSAEVRASFLKRFGPLAVPAGSAAAGGLAYYGGRLLSKAGNAAKTVSKIKYALKPRNLVRYAPKAARSGGRLLGPVGAVLSAAEAYRYMQRKGYDVSQSR